MNPGHIHLLLNHVPTIGFGIGLALYVMALFLNQEHLRRVGFVILFLAAALSIPTYVSGNDAREALKETPGISDPLMQVHESAALVALFFMEITGFFSWIGLWISDRPSPFARLNVWLVLVFGALTFVLMARAAYIGGAIRHPETDTAQTIPLDANVPTLARTWGVFNQDHSWLWPAAETIHFVGLCLLFGVVLIYNLRVLGVGRALVPFESLRQLLPLGMLGFTLNLLTGMMFFVATPEQYTGFLFFLKMSLVVAGAIQLLYFMLRDKDDAGIWTRLIAFSGILIWVAVLFCGHMLPWLGNSF
jgi:hypothetical protein